MKGGKARYAGIVGLGRRDERGRRASIGCHAYCYPHDIAGGATEHLAAGGHLVRLIRQPQQRAAVALRDDPYWPCTHHAGRIEVDADHAPNSRGEGCTRRLAELFSWVP